MRSLFLATFLTITLPFASPSRALNVGDKATPFKLKDPFGKVWTLSSFKKRVLTIWYVGQVSRKQNLWLQSQIRKAKRTGRLNLKNYVSFGIANFRESAAPNFLMHLAVKRVARKSGELILIDPDARMQRHWGFRNGRSNIYTFDAQRRLLWKSSGPLSRRRARQFLRFIIRLSR